MVSCFAEGPEAVYAIGSDQHLTAAYYRNTIIHFFVNGAIAELALLGAAEAERVDRAAAFWDEALGLRDLLKFEFFFAEKDEFRQEVRAEIGLHDPDWEACLAAGPDAMRALLRRFRPLSAHRVLLPFLDAYRVVGDALEQVPVEARIEEPAFLTQCLALGKQYQLQRRIRTAESVTQVLFATALRLARNRSLVGPGGADLSERRAAFAHELRRAVRRGEAVDALAASRRAGLIV
jgi:glycerol-3-phosphate O-acyltransferase